MVGVVAPHVRLVFAGDLQAVVGVTAVQAAHGEVADMPGEDAGGKGGGRGEGQGEGGEG